MSNTETDIMNYFSNGAIHAGTKEINDAVQSIAENNPEIKISEIKATVFTIAEKILADSTRFMNSIEIEKEFNLLKNK